MIEFKKKREQIRSSLRCRQKEVYFRTIRQQLIDKYERQQYLSETEELFILAYLKSETPDADLFNIYANIQNQLTDVLVNHTTYDFVSKLAIWLYLQLTSCQSVIDYVSQKYPIREWTLLQLLLVKFVKCEEYIYDRMRVFLENVCLKHQLSPYHNFGEQKYGPQLSLIFSHLTTQKITDFPVPIDDQSQYYGFVSCYVSLMPNSHIIPLINQGFPQTFMHNSNNSILLTFLGRLQLLSENSSCFLQYCKDLSDLFHQSHEMPNE